MMFTMCPPSRTSRSWPSTSSLENIHVFDPKSYSCDHVFPSAPRRMTDTGTQTDFDERQERCHRVSVSLTRGSIRFELSLKLVPNPADDQQELPMWMTILGTVCTLFTACYRPH